VRAFDRGRRLIGDGRICAHLFIHDDFDGLVSQAGTGA
jgi:hypothetical protein